MTDVPPTPGPVPNEIPPLGVLITAAPLDANGVATTQGVNSPSFVLNDVSVVFTLTPSSDGLSATLVPNAGIEGSATVTWNAADPNGNPLLDPSTGAAPVYLAAVSPGNAVSATLSATPIEAPAPPPA